MALAGFFERSTLSITASTDLAASAEVKLVARAGNKVYIAVNQDLEPVSADVLPDGQQGLSSQLEEGCSLTKEPYPFGGVATAAFGQIDPVDWG